MELNKIVHVEPVTLTDEFGDSWVAYGVFEDDDRKPCQLARPYRLTDDPESPPRVVPFRAVAARQDQY